MSRGSKTELNRTKTDLQSKAEKKRQGMLEQQIQKQNTKPVPPS